MNIKIENLEQGARYEIEYHDHYEGDNEGEFTLTEVGYFVGSGSNYIYFYMGKDSRGEYHNRSAVYVPCIKRMERL